MGETIAPTPIDSPDLVVPGTAPPTHLASAALLHLLDEVGGAVVVVDMVAHETARDRTKPGAEILHAWLARGRAPGSDRPVRVEETETGRLSAAMRETRPDCRLRDGGEAGIVARLAERIAGADRAVIVLHGNGRVPTIVRDQSLDADVDALTAHAFLDGVERRQRMARGDDPNIPDGRCWDRVVAEAPTANPRSEGLSHRRPPR